MAAIAAAQVATAVAAGPSLKPRSRLASSQASLAGAAVPLPLSRTVARGSFVVRATNEEVSGTQKQILEAVETAKEKWDKVEDKPTVLLYTGGAVLALWITNSVIGSLDRIPLVPDFLKLVGTLYSGWFVYRYLLFESSRKELKEVVEDLKSKIASK